MSEFQNQVGDFVAFSENLNFKHWVSRMVIFQQKNGRKVWQDYIKILKLLKLWKLYKSNYQTVELCNFQKRAVKDLHKFKVYSLDPIQSQGEPKELSKVLMSLANVLHQLDTTLFCTRNL